MKNILLAIGTMILLQSCTQVEDAIKNIDVTKLEQIGEQAAEQIAIEVVKDETGIDLTSKP